MEAEKGRGEEGVAGEDGADVRGGWRGRGGGFGRVEGVWLKGGFRWVGYLQPSREWTALQQGRREKVGTS